jgi:MOSC domain-containing protein YiiM
VRLAPIMVSAHPGQPSPDVWSPELGSVEPVSEGVSIEIVALLASPVHAYAGRPGDGPLPDAAEAGQDCLELRAGLGIIGDRYYNHAAHRLAAVTVFAAESVDALADELGLDAAPDPLRTRRNIVVRGFPVDELAAGRGQDGAVFSIDSGEGPVRLRAHRPAYPCRWMDVVLAPGAFRGLRGRSGVRCAALDDGILRRGPAVLRVLEPATSSR